MTLKSQVGKLCYGRKLDQGERWQTLKMCSSQQPWKIGGLNAPITLHAPPSTMSLIGAIELSDKKIFLH